MSTESNDNRSWLEKLREMLLQEPQTKQQLLDLINHAEQHEVIDKDAMDMINGVISVSEKQVRDVMVPRTQMVVIPGNKTAAEILPLIVNSGHSRFPVIGEIPDKIIGILMAKDLLKVINDKSNNMQVHRLVRPTNFVPETQPLDTLLKEFRQNRNHLAVVIDEYGETSGLITIEDVLEEIVGEIDDEYDTQHDRKYINKKDNHLFQVKALTTIDEFNQFFSTQYATDNVDTIGGFLLKKFNCVPKKGETIQVEHIKFMVVKASSRGIIELEVMTSC